MAINLDNLIQATGPSDAEIDAEFNRIDHQQLLDRIVATGRPAVAPRRSARRWAVPAAAVAALAIGGGMLATQLQPAPSATTTTTGPAIVKTAPATGTKTAPATNTNQAAGNPVLALSNMALTAAHQKPLVIGANQYLHVQFVETQTGSSAGTVTHDTYIANDGWTWRHDTGDTTMWMLYDAGYANPGSMPTDPAKLDAALRAGTGNNSGDERVWKGVDEILVSNSAAPALRAASIQTLQNLALHPHSPEVGKEGKATPKVTVKWMPLAGGEQGVQATFTDAATRPGVTWTITLDEQGNVVSQGQTSPDGSYVATYPVRQLVNALPADFAAQLGTQRVHVEK